VNRRAFVTGLGAVLAAPLGAGAQPAGRVYRVGILGATSRSLSAAPAHLEEALRELGYVDGKNVILDWRFAEGQLDKLPALADDLVRANVDVLVAISPFDISAAKRATATIPVVMIYGNDPVGAGAVSSLALPAGNVTGTTFYAPETSSKVLQMLKDAVPAVRSVDVLWDAGTPGRAAYQLHLDEASKSLGAQLRYFWVERGEDVDRAIAEMDYRRPDAVLIASLPVVLSRRAHVIDFLNRRRLPSIATQSTWPRVGTLMSFSVDDRALLRRSATYIDKILKGVKPRDLPVEQPTKYELVINLRTAKALGLTIPPSLLLRADEVIE
jgi:putative tryptophan/tyrosine transport system substrate-binding protein